MSLHSLYVQRVVAATPHLASLAVPACTCSGALEHGDSCRATFATPPSSTQPQLGMLVHGTS